jgi:hypothetical protein
MDLSVVIQLCPVIKIITSREGPHSPIPGKYTENRPPDKAKKNGLKIYPSGKSSSAEGGTSF